MEPITLEASVAQRVEAWAGRSSSGCGNIDLSTLWTELELHDHNERAAILDFVLLHAVQSGKEALVLQMLQSGARVNQTHRRGRRGLVSPLIAMFTASNAAPQLSLAELLLKHGADVNLVDENGNSAVGAATLRGYDAFVLLFLETGKVIMDLVNGQGNSLLHLAVSRPSTAQDDRASLIDLLLRHGARLDAQNLQKDTPLIKAVRQGSLSSVTALLEHIQRHDRSAALTANAKGLSALHEAAVWGHASVLDALLATGIFDVDMRDADGNTALLLAGDRKRVGAIVNTDPLLVVRTLISRGASVVAQNNMGQTVFHLPDCSIEFLTTVLSSASPTDSSLWSLQDNSGNAPIMAHFKAGRPYHVQALATFIDSSLLPPWDALLELTSPSHHRCIGQLIAIDAVDALKALRKQSVVSASVGDELLAVAIRSFALHCLVFLIEDCGCQLTPELITLCHSHRDDGQTILHKACRLNNARAAQLLLAAGMDVNVANEDLDEFSEGGLPIHDAALSGATECLSILLKFEADLNSQVNPGQESPLHLAVRFNRVEATKFLLENGADPSVVDIDGNSVSDEACLRPDTDPEIITLLSS